MSSIKRILQAWCIRVFCVVLIFCTSCTTTTYQIASYAQRYGLEKFAPTESVEVYYKGTPLARAHRVIGVLEIAGGPDTKKSDLIKAALAQARALGADATARLTRKTSV